MLICLEDIKIAAEQREEVDEKTDGSTIIDKVMPILSFLQVKEYFKQLGNIYFFNLRKTLKNYRRRHRN